MREVSEEEGVPFDWSLMIYGWADQYSGRKILDFNGYMSASIIVFQLMFLIK